MNRFFKLLILLPVMALLGACAFVNVPLTAKPGPLQEQELEGDGGKKILLLDINGTLSEHEKSAGLLGNNTPSPVSLVRESLRKAQEDKDVAGLILRIDSPGGSVTASDIIRHDIIEFKKRRHIPVVACIVGMGASGGYYAATAADRIMAHPTAVTGSIGVILMKFNLAGLMAKLGVEEQTVKSGDKKDILSPFRRATPEEERLAQGIIDQFHGRFLDMIMERPGNTLTRPALAKLADGRVYTAQQALDAHLIDDIGYLDDAITAMRKTIGDSDAKVVSYYRQGAYRGSIHATADATSGLPAALNGMGALSGAGFMYLWQP